MTQGKHLEFLNSVFLENLDSEKCVDEVRLQCKDGELFLTKFLVGFVFKELQNSLEFNLSLCDQVLLPLHSCDELIDYLNRCLQYDKSVISCVHNQEESFFHHMDPERNQGDEEFNENDADKLEQAFDSNEENDRSGEACEHENSEELLIIKEEYEESDVYLPVKDELSCEVCNEYFDAEGELNAHRRARHSYECPYCDAVFKSDISLVKHSKRKHNISATSKEPDDKMAPRIERGKKGSYKCAECGKIFAYKKKLELHQNLHTKPHSCPHCGLCFSNTFKLSVHQIQIHNKGDTDAKLHQCDECDKVFPAPSMLKRHRRTHTKDRPYTCTECGKCFALKHNLRVHERIHFGTSKIYTCSFPPCERKFSHPRERKDHEGVHTGEKSFTCTYCGQSYQRHSNLWKHRKKCALEHQFSQHLEKLKENFETEEPVMDQTDIKEIHVLSLVPETQMFEVGLSEVTVEHML